MGDACTTYWREKRAAYRVLMGKYEGKRTLGKPNHRWEDSIKVGFQKVGWDCVNWIALILDWTGVGLL
jgi:hypothetical protein